MSQAAEVRHGGAVSKTQKCLDYIRSHESARSDEIGNAINEAGTVVSALLARFVKDGTLVTCKVERSGQRQPVNEYRYSVAGGGRTTEWRGDLCLKAATPPQRQDAPPKKNGAHVPAAAVTPCAEPQPASPRLGAIEKGIPLPGSKRGNGELKEHISKLEVGDSFVTDYSDSACYGMARRLGMKVISRPADGKSGKRNRSSGEQIRVWRTE